jgi:tetratricopeptide (TPR) repeat protein
MAPEQAAGGDLDARADMYAFAATVCEALTGRRLRAFADRGDAVAALQAESLRLSPRLVEALSAPLSLSAAERPATMRAWIDTVTAADRPTHRRLILTGAGVAVVAVVAGIWGLLPAPAPSGAGTIGDGQVIAVPPFADATQDRLGRALPAVFEEELRWVPAVQVVPAAAVARLVGNADLTNPLVRDSVLPAVFTQFEASGVLSGSLEPDEGSGIRLSVELRRADGTTTTVPTVRGAPDSLAAMVATAVLGLFELGDRQAPYRSALPGGGLEARMALWLGDSLFQASAYEAAIEQYNRVLELDSTYALAAFKRMLAEVMRAQPTRASRAVRSALEPVVQYSRNLDRMNRELLGVYERLVTDGDIEGAHGLVRDLTDRYPLAVDAWLVRGYLEFYFGPLFGTPPANARIALERAEKLNPGFAVVHAVLAFLAFSDGDDERAREQLDAYLAIDSTSGWAETARLAKVIRFGGARERPDALRSLEDRSVTTLELIALAGKSLQIERAERLLANDAARILRDRATSGEERATAFRLELGNAMGTGRAATVDTLLREARRRTVPRPEIDRTTVLLTVTGLHPAGADAEMGDAASRLLADPVDPSDPWLAARWFRGRDERRARDARQELQRMADAGGGPAILARSLLGDLDALDTVAAGDTAAAFGLWAAATRRFQIEEVPFGLVASLWPLRLEWARVAAARRDFGEVAIATITFEVSPGFMDQVARPVVLPLRADALAATGGGLLAKALRERYAAVLRDATGPWRALRDSLLALSGGT